MHPTSPAPARYTLTFVRPLRLITMATSRRDFLRASLAAPLAFELAGCSRAPAWYFEALRAIRSEGKPGLVFRVPADAKRRCALGHGLAWLVERTDVVGLSVSQRSVLLCLESEGIRRWIDGARDGQDLFLIDGDGVVQAGTLIEADKDLASQAAALLPGHRESKDPVAETAIRALAPPAPRLPYGVSLATGVDAPCKENPACPAGKGCGPCGMAVITPRSRAFVKFLAG